MIRIYLDCETTGTDLKVHHMHQLAGIIVKDGVEIERFNLEFRPAVIETADAEALEKTRMSKEILSTRPLSHVEAYHMFVAILGKHCDKYNKKDKLILVGFRVGFDDDFLRKLFDCNGDSYYGSWFWTPAVDLMSVTAWLLVAVRKEMHNFKLETVCKTAGLTWDESKAHDAMYDIEKTVELDQFLLSNFTQ